MAERDRLRPLQMRVARHRRLRVAGRALEDRRREGGERGIRLGAGVVDVEAERRGDLVVPRSAGVDLPPHLTELGLDERVNVLGCGIDRVERGQRLPHLRELGDVEDPGGVQPLCMEQRARDVVGQQLGVVGLQEAPDLGRELRADATGPERHSGRCPWRSSIARVSAMSLICTASCPMRSAAVNAVALRSMLRRSGSYVTDSPLVSRIV